MTFPAHSAGSEMCEVTLLSDVARPSQHVGVVL